MTKFIFKSDKSDLQKIIAVNETIQKNILYMTYRIDSMMKTLNKIAVDKSLQKQVDEYFEDDSNPDNPESIQNNKEILQDND